MKPVTAQPGYTAADLIALLATKRFTWIDAYTFINKDGVTLCYSTAKRNIQVTNPVAGGPPVVYTSREVKVSGLDVDVSVGVEVDEQEMKLDYSPTQNYQGLPFSQALMNGKFDGGVVRRDRYFRADWDSPVIAGVPMFVGNVSTLDKVGRSESTMKVKSDCTVFELQMPHKVYTPGCLHVFGDPGCGIDRTAFSTSGTTLAGSTDSIINWAGATELMAKGTIQILDLGGATEIRTIDDVVVGSQLLLSSPLDFEPAVGTSFVAIQGCLRTYAACGTYANTANYLGFPFVPVAETASGSV